MGKLLQNTTRCKQGDGETMCLRKLDKVASPSSESQAFACFKVETTAAVEVVWSSHEFPNTLDHGPFSHEPKSGPRLGRAGTAHTKRNQTQCRGEPEAWILVLEHRLTSGVGVPWAG